jgi:hypothetical protein
MDWRNLIGLALLGFTASALATPVARLSDTRPANLFQEAAAWIAQRDPLTNQLKVNPSTGKPEDPRGALTLLGPHLGLSVEEIERLRTNTGYVYCLDTATGQLSDIGSGGLVGTSGALIWTAKHVVLELATNKVTGGKCYFQNQAVPAHKIELDMAASSFDVIEPDPPDYERDGIIQIRTKGKLTGARPFPVAEPSSDFPMILVIAHQPQMAVKVDVGEPVVQSCYIKRLDGMFFSRGAGRVYSDCSIDPGSSGSLGFIRVDGDLKVASLTARGGSDNMGGCTYNLDTKCFAFAFGVSSVVSERLTEFESKSGNK